MSQTFFPKKSITISASEPHPKETQYKISIGEENWGKERREIIKVQMVYKKKIAGRKSPSYPIGTDDYKRVNQAIETLNKELKESKDEYQKTPKPNKVQISMEQ